MRKYFVYQNWTTEKLYASGLTYKEANEKFNELNHLIESGCFGDGCATIGNLEDESDFFIAQRLGLIDKSFSSWEDYMETMDNVASDLSLREEHESMYGTEND